MYLLDTNVISELRKQGSARADANVSRWERSVAPSHMYLSVMTLFELELGMLRLERYDAPQSALLRSWIEQKVIPAFDGRILPIDLPIVQQAALLHVPNPKPDRDAMIAATALVHHMTVVTRNTADFLPAGVRILNPWE